MTVIGYPMQNIDAAYEAESARIWEEQNRQTDTELLRLASKSLRLAADDLDSTCGLVNEAAEAVVDTPEGDRIASILGEMESILKGIREMAEKWSR